MTEPNHTIPTDEVVELIQQLIRNGCVNDGTIGSGHEDRSVATLAEYFGETGEVVEPQPGRQSVVYRVQGRTTGAPTLMLLPHLDVVPVNEAGWTHDPFGGEVDDGFVWGRGAIDMLNVTAAGAAAFKRYLTGEVAPLAGDLIFAAVADEEAGGTLGAEWLLAHRPDLVACDYLLTEIATPHLSQGPGAGLPVTVAEKGPQWRSLATSGIPSHGSQPYRTKNAMVPLAHAISMLAEADTPVEISEGWKTFVVGSGLPAELVDRLCDPQQIDDALDDVAEIDAGLARWAHACTRMTLTPTVFSAGVKNNIVPDEGTAEIDIRIVPGQDESTVDDHLRKVLGHDLYDEIDIAPGTQFEPTASPAEGPLWEAIADAAEDIAGSRTLLPMLIPVTTDARFFRARGVTAYGVGMFDDRMRFGEMLGLFHGNDERVSVDSLGLTTRLIAQTMRRFGVHTERSA